MSDTPSDRQLFNRWSKGDTAARDLLYERYQDSLYRVFDRLFETKRPHEVEELIEATFLSCLRARDAFWPDDSFRKQLFSIASNRCIDFLCARQRGRVIDSERTGEPGGPEDAPDELN